MQIQLMRAKSGEPLQYKGVFDAAIKIYKQNGLTSVYQGLSATFLRNIPSYEIYFGWCS